MSSIRRFFRSFFTVCGTDINIKKSEYSTIGVVEGKEAYSCVDEGIQPDDLPIKRRRAMTVETERMSCCSEKNSCLSSDDDYDCTTSKATLLTLAEIKLTPSLVEDLTCQAPTDPITLEPVCEPKFIYTHSCSMKVTEYNLVSFVEYLLSTGDFRDPISRQELSVQDIENLDDKILKLDLKYPILMKKYMEENKSNTTENDLNTVRGLESCIGEIIVDVLETIEEPSKSSIYQMQMLFSEMDAPFKEMRALNIEAAYQALQTWKMFLKGPPKRPTTDKGGRLNHAITYLDSQWDIEDTEKLNEIRATSMNRTVE